MTSDIDTIRYTPAADSTAVPPLSLAAQFGNLLFVSGTPGYDAQRKLAADFASQFEQAVANLRDILRRAGADPHRLLKVNMLLTRLEDVAEMNRLYAVAFGPAPYPARTTCVVRSLPDPAMLLEIEAVAVASIAAAEPGIDGAT